MGLGGGPGALPGRQSPKCEPRRGQKLPVPQSRTQGSFPREGRPRTGAHASLGSDEVRAIVGGWWPAGRRELDLCQQSLPPPPELVLT